MLSPLTIESIDYTVLTDGLKLSYFWHDDKQREDVGDHNVHPKQPSQENEIRCDHRAETRLNFFDSNLPRNEQRTEIVHLALHVLEFLSERKLWK